MAFDDVVFLVPGFLGFSRVGGFYYFADRVSVTLRSTLEALRQRSVPVVPVCTLPSDHLVERQKRLVDAIGDRLRHIGDVKRIHLVGHSAGGVDAQLLTCDSPLNRDRWSSGAERIRSRIASVVSIAAPHHGTCLSDAPVARLIADPVVNARWWPTAVGPILGLLRLAANQANGPEIVWNALDHLPDSGRFLLQFLVRRGLILDLSPRCMSAIRRHWHRERRKDIVFRSFVTVTRPSMKAEPFFRDLSSLTADTSQSPATTAVQTAVSLLNDRAAGALRSAVDAPSFDDRANDGVVNSARQIVDPGDRDELAGIVVADHADVMGHYDRQDELISERPLNHGLFHSGAAFRDDQFFTLYRRVAEIIADVIPKAA